MGDGGSFGFGGGAPLGSGFGFGSGGFTDPTSPMMWGAAHAAGSDEASTSSGSRYSAGRSLASRRNVSYAREKQAEANRPQKEPGKVDDVEPPSLVAEIGYYAAMAFGFLIMAAIAAAVIGCLIATGLWVPALVLGISLAPSIIALLFR
ncbi:hypothetical protein AALA69_06655 [Eggerthellaceae bacterium 24-137]